jgi:hypothetical protein
VSARTVLDAMTDALNAVEWRTDTRAAAVLDYLGIDPEMPVDRLRALVAEHDTAQNLDSAAQNPSLDRESLINQIRERISQRSHDPWDDGTTIYNEPLSADQESCARGGIVRNVGLVGQGQDQGPELIIPISGRRSPWPPPAHGTSVYPPRHIWNGTEWTTRVGQEQT